MPPMNASASAIEQPQVGAAVRNCIDAPRDAGAPASGCAHRRAAQSPRRRAPAPRTRLSDACRPTPCSAERRLVLRHRDAAQRRRQRSAILQHQLHCVAARRAVDSCFAGKSSCSGRGTRGSADGTSRPAQRLRLHRQQQLAPGALHLRGPALQRLRALRRRRARTARHGPSRPASRSPRAPAAQLQRRAFSGMQMSLQTSQSACARNVSVSPGRAVGGRGVAKRQQQLAFIAVVDERADRQALAAPAIRSRLRGFLRAASSASRRQAGIAGVAPIRVPVRYVLQLQTDRQRLAPAARRCARQRARQ